MHRGTGKGEGQRSRVVGNGVVSQPGGQQVGRGGVRQRLGGSGVGWNTGGRGWGEREKQWWCGQQVGKASGVTETWAMEDNLAEKWRLCN